MKSTGPVVCASLLAVVSVGVWLSSSRQEAATQPDEESTETSTSVEEVAELQPVPDEFRRLGLKSANFIPEDWSIATVGPTPEMQEAQEAMRREMEDQFTEFDPQSGLELKLR